MDTRSLMRLSELLRRKVRTESGRELGHVHDVRAEQRGDRLFITGVIVGRHALLEHFGIGLSPGTTSTKMRTSATVIPWSAVVRLGPGTLIVRDDTEPA
jgi:sporulation protein YlmC with PRC-barrel domain